MKMSKGMAARLGKFFLVGISVMGIWLICIVMPRALDQWFLEQYQQPGEQIQDDLKEKEYQQIFIGTKN